jgi:digeranylgeranylglycerophospholipid reductase
MVSTTDVLVVGASFAGLACAEAAAACGLRVRVIDRKPAADAYPHTTGLLVKEAADAWPVPREYLRPVRGVRLYAPSGARVDLSSPGYAFYAMDLARAMRWHAGRAAQAGAAVWWNCPFRGLRSDRNTLAVEGPEISARFVVGADGPRSAVAQAAGLDRNSRFLQGVEWEFSAVRGLDAQRLHCFLDSALAPGYLAWALEGTGGAQIGMAARTGMPLRMVRLLERLRGLFDFDDAKLCGRRGGYIPVGGALKNFAAERVLLIGDAAGLVSPLTAGGIHTALSSGWRAGIALADHLLSGGAHPAETLRARRPRFFFKRALRRLLDCDPPNWVYDRLLDSFAVRGLAQTVFFHHRGLFGAQAWRELFSATRIRGSDETENRARGA